MDGLMNGTDHYADANPLAGNKTLQTLQQRYRYLLDKTTPHTAGRWVAWLAMLVIYGLRTWYLKGTLMIQLPVTSLFSYRQICPMQCSRIDMYLCNLEA